MSLQLNFNKDHYHERVIKLLENLLSSDFLNTNLYTLDDISLESFFRTRSEGYIQPQDYTDRIEKVIHNFCTIGETNGYITMNIKVQCIRPH